MILLPMRSMSMYFSRTLGPLLHTYLPLLTMTFHRKHTSQDTDSAFLSTTSNVSGSYDLEETGLKHLKRHHKSEAKKIVWGNTQVKAAKRCTYQNKAVLFRPCMYMHDFQSLKECQGIPTRFFFFFANEDK